MESLYFPVKLSLRLDWSEMDIFHHINNVMYFKFIQASRVNYWEEVSIMKDFDTMGIGPMLASTGCQFKKPLHYPGDIVVEARMEFIKNSSFGLHHRILNETQEVCAEAHDVIVMYNFQKKQSVPFPPELRAAVESLEKKSF